MTGRRIERLGAAAGLVAAVSVGVPVLVDQLRGDGELTGAVAWLWWACYLGYLVVFSALDGQRVRWLTERRLFAVQAATGAAAVVLAPGIGWMPVLLVVTAVTAAFVLTARGAVAVLVAHSVLLAAVAFVDGAGVAEAVLAVLVYGSLQLFGMLMVWSEQREAAAHARLAATNAELRAATALLSESTRTAERLRIARDLHDVVGHQLTALALELEVASHRATPPASEHVARARDIAKDLLSDVRATVGDLRVSTPPLRHALEALAADLPRPKVHVQVDEELTLDGERTTALVRCVQEIVTNAVRHADADNLWVEVTGSNTGQALLRAYDDGRGTPELRLGNGLTGLRERVEQLGGAVTFEHRQGFQVVAQVPSP